MYLLFSELEIHTKCYSFFPENFLYIMCLILYKRNLFTVNLVLKKENLTVMLVSKSHIILIFCIMQLVNQFHRARKVNSIVVVLTSVFLRVKFVMHTKIAQMVKMNPLLVVSVA